MVKQTVVSKIEHRLLLAVILFCLMIRFLNLLTSVYFAEPKPGISFAIYSIFEMEDMMSPIYSFIVFFLCLILLWKIEIISMFSSTFLTSLLTIFFDTWFVDTQFLISRAFTVNPNYEFKTFDFLLINGSPYDVFTLLIVNLLVIWQVHILFRLIADRKKQTSLK